MLQRRLPFQPDTTTNEIIEREKEMKFFMLNILNDVISDALKRPATDQDGLM